MMVVLYFTWPAWTQGPPESQRVTHFYCEAHLLCMHFSHTGIPKHEHLPIMPTRRAEHRADSENCILTWNNSCPVQGTRPSTAPGIYLIHIDTFLAVGREWLFIIICLITVSSFWNKGTDSLSLFISSPGAWNKSAQEKLKDQSP